MTFFAALLDFIAHYFIDPIVSGFFDTLASWFSPPTDTLTV